MREGKELGANVHSKGRKWHLGVMLDIKPSQGGSFQYIEYILDALSELTDTYEITVIYIQEEWEAVLRSVYPDFSRYAVSFSHDMMTQEIDDLHCDYLLFPMHSTWYYYALNFKTPLIASVHDVMHYYEPKNSDDLIYNHPDEYYWSVLRHSAGIFVDSELGKKQFAELYGKAALPKIYPLPFRAPNYLYQEEEQPVPLKNKKYIFYPSQMPAHKNHINLILAVDYLRKKGVIVNLVFSGMKNGLYEYIVHLIEALSLESQIDILGYVSGPELKYLYRHARAMAMSTYDGPTNIPPIEAMHMGCPIAVSNIYAMPEQVGDAGLLFNPKSIEDIADKLEILWMDDNVCCNLSANAKKRAWRYSRQTFNECFKTNIENIINTYEEETRCSKELLDLCNNYSKIYIYGAGRIGTWIHFFLLNSGIEIDGFIVSNRKDSGMHFWGLEVFCINDMKQMLKDALLILAMGEKEHKVVERGLSGSEIGKIYPIKEKNKLEAYTYFARNH